MQVSLDSPLVSPIYICTLIPTCVILLHVVFQNPCYQYGLLINTVIQMIVTQFVPVMSLKLYTSDSGKYGKWKIWQVTSHWQCKSSKQASQMLSLYDNATCGFHYIQMCGRQQVSYSKELILVSLRITRTDVQLWSVIILNSI